MPGRKWNVIIFPAAFQAKGRAAAAIGISRAAFYKKLVAHRAAGRMAPAGAAED